MDFSKHAFLLAVIESLRSYGTAPGKTYVQKASFIIQETTNAQVPFQFVLYKHGPYSFEIDPELEEMLSYSAIDSKPVYDQGVVFTPSTNAPYVKNKAQLSLETREAIDHVCAAVAGRTVVDLEKLATAIWIRKRNGITDSRAVAQRLHELKPHIPVADAEQADTEVVRTLLTN